MRNNKSAYFWHAKVEKMKQKKLFAAIKETIRKIEPDSTIVLFGSYARGDYNYNSDIDLLILVN